MRITDLFNFFFRVSAINKFYIKISEKSWLKNEPDTYDYGYYYALYSTYINIVVTFGYSLLTSVQVPLLYVGLVITLALKLFADGVKITNVHGWDIEGSGKLHELALTRIQFGTLIPHLLYANQCFWNKNYRTMAINIIMVLYSIVMVILFKKNRLAHLQPTMRILDKLEFQDIKKRDVVNWVFRYSHPYIRVMGPKNALPIINELNSPISHEPQVHPELENQRRFNMPIPGDSPLKLSLASASVLSNEVSGGAEKRDQKKFTFQPSNKNIIKANPCEEGQNPLIGDPETSLKTPKDPPREKSACELLISELKDEIPPNVYHFKKDWEESDKISLKSPIFIGFDPNSRFTLGAKRLSNVPEVDAEHDDHSPRHNQHRKGSNANQFSTSLLVPPLGHPRGEIEPEVVLNGASHLAVRSNHTLVRQGSTRKDLDKVASRSEQNSPSKINKEWFTPTLVLSKKTTKMSIVSNSDPLEDDLPEFPPATGLTLETSEIVDIDLEDIGVEIPLEPIIYSVARPRSYQEDRSAQIQPSPKE